MIEKTFQDFGIAVPSGRTGEVATTCPQCSPHRQKNPKAKCLSVNVDKGIWHCNHCDWSGTLKEGTRFKSDPFANRPREYRKPTYDKSGNVPDVMLQWFAQRGIPADVVRRNGITKSEVYMPQVEANVDAIRFPYTRDGVVVNIKSRDKHKNFRMETGAERILYGLDDCRGVDTAIFVEGEIDKLSVETAGFINCLSVPDGAPSPKSKDYTSKFTFLESASELLDGLKKIIIAVDNDAPGQKLEEELTRRLGIDSCFRVEWPEGCKDANDVLVKFGKETLQGCIESAKPYPVAGLFEVADFSPMIDRMYREGLPPGAKPGWASIDKLITFQPGQFSIATGIPGHGKSEFLDAVFVNLATTYGWTFAIFSPENQPLELHFQKIAEKFIGKPFFKSARTPRMTLTDLETAKSWVAKHFSFILPESENLSVDSVLKLARTAVQRKGVRGVIIDPWNELDHTRPPSLTETEYISSSLTKIRRFARETGSHVWLVAHPSKLRKERDSSGNMVYPVPTPYDISGSAHWRNKADNALTVYRDVTSEGSLVQVHVQKVRFKHCGKPGVAELEYDILTGRYSEPRTEIQDHQHQDIIDLDAEEAAP